MTEYIIANYFAQMQRAGELMAERDAEMVKVIEEMQASGYSLKSIDYGF